MKDIFNKCQRFSIRKLSFGVVSALLGAVLFGTPQEVLASTENNLTSSIEPSSEIVNSITTVEKKEEVQNNSENRDNVSDPAPKDMSGVATRTAELREPGDKENNRTVKPTFVSGRDRSSNLETRASAPSSDIKKYELTEEYAKQIKSGEIGLEGNKLDSLLLDGPQLNPNGFTDDDFLSDKDEIYIYEKNGKKYVGYNSHPLLEDTDGDGIIDSKEKPDEKLKWNVSERDMIMFMELAYREDNYIDRVLDYKRPLSESELFKRAGDKKPRYEYMMMNKELGPYWKRKKSYHTSSGLDAVLFETKSDFPFLPNGTAQVLAFRGTSDAKDIKADVTLGIGGNPQQGIDAENIISELAKDKSITNLYLTGHSLGGYLVQRAMVEAYQLAYSNNRVMSTQENVAYRNFYNNILKKGTTFNAPKVVTSLVSNREFWKKGLDSKKIAQSGKMTHYIVDNDQTIKKDVSNDSDVVINVGATSGRHSSRSYFENNMINIRPEFISGKRVSLDRTGYQDKNISTIKSVEKVGEKIVYSKNGDDIFKSTTISMRDSDTGEVTEKVTNEIFKKDGAKNKVETTEIPSLKKYVKDDRREKGQENITILGKAGSKTTTTAYTVNPETGEVTPNVGKPVIVAPTTTVIKVAAKDKVVYSKEGNNIVKETTTYKVDPDNGNITENTTKEIFKENGLKDKVAVETIQSPVKYVKDTTREKGQENITIPGKAGSKTTTTTYTVNSETGEVTPNVGKPVIVAPTTTVIKVAAKDKVVYSKEGNNIVKATTTYKVDPDNGNITENTTKEIFKENGLKDKVAVETIQSPVKYVKDTTREKGQENITIPGKAGSKTTTTTYTVNPETGEVTELVGTPEVKNATETVVKVAAKDKVEVVQRENGKKVKVTTVYMVDEKTGNITQTEREEEISSEVITSKSEEKVPTVELKPFEGGVNPAESVVTEELKPFEGGVNPAESVVTEELKPFEGGVNPAESVVTEELKPFEGGVNPAESVVTEELPELKVALLRDEEGNILDVLAISEKQKELKGYKYTGKEEVDNEGNKIYIYQKDNSEVVTSKPEEKVPTIELKPFEGGVNPAESVVTEELKPFEGGVNPAESVVTEELKPFEGGVNPAESVVTEELPELKVALLRDEEGNILDVLAISEKQKELKGYKYTGKEEVDDEGNKIYTYQKDNSEVVTSKPEEKVPTIELKPFEGGVNPAESVVTEELPELKVALLRDEEGNILDVLAISEKQKELKGYKYTGKEEVDDEGNKIYTYQKDNSEVVTSKPEEKVPTIELKPFEGGVNPAESVVTEELKPFEGGVNPAESVVTEELKPFEGGVNPAESVVTEELPELKVALLRDEEGNILDVLAISEKQKELKGYKYTGKEEVDDEGNKIYTYQKDNSEVVTSKPEEKVPTIELKPFEGGVNPAESVVTEELKPFEGGVNPAESVVTEELKPFEGGVNSEESVVTEELKPFEGGANPVESVVTEELKPFEGGVNVEIPAVKEELPELKLALLKDEEGDILDVLAISEKPKELNGYKYTGKEKVDSEGNKIYIYKKVGLNTIQTVEQDTIVANQSQVLKENIENKTEITTDRNDKKTVDKILPNTGEKPLEHGVLGGMLLAATMILAKRKVKK